jgi:2-dehydropantoate 2-reductase
VDLLIITTKAYDTMSAVDACRDWAAPSTGVLTLQNGLRNLDIIRGWKGPRAFGGTTSLGASLMGPGHVEVSGLGRTIIGSDLDPAGASEISAALAECGLPAEVKRDVRGEIWSKGIVNACINPATAVLRVPNGTLLDSEAVTELMGGVCEECQAIAEAHGVLLPYPDMFSVVKAVARDTARNRSSMLRDVELGRRTEIREINGAFVGLAEEKGVRVPLNKALVAMVEALESGLSKKA